MLAKLAAVILSIGACACGLLALRQSRLQTAHELTRSQFRIRAADERLWMLRAEIARRVSPPEIEAMAAGIGGLKPIIPGGVPALPADTHASAADAQEPPR